MIGGSNLPWTSHTGRMREMERVVRAMADVGAPAFRLFTAITQGMNEESGIFYCRDEIMAMSCGLQTRQSVSAARAALRKKSLIDFAPGRSGKATEYRLTISDEALLDHLAILSERKSDEKMELNRDAKRRSSVKKSLPSASRNHDAKQSASVKKSLPSASRNLHPLHPQPIPSVLTTDAGLDSVGEQASESLPSQPIVLATIGEVIDFIDAHPSKPNGLAAEWPSKADLERGEKVIGAHLERASRELGFTVDEATAAIGDELLRITRAVAEFPGDGDRAGRRIKRLLADARAKRAA